MKVRYSPDGLHLFNRSTGLNILFDEIQIPYRTWSKAPRIVSIAITNQCDLNCPYCYIHHSTDFLDYSNLTEWISELDKNGCASVGFGGGEPTLHPEIENICSFVHTHTKMGVTLTTHGHNLNKRLLKKLSEYLNFIRISMDGIGRTYEKLRSRSFSELVDNIKTVKKLIPFGINFLVNKDTITDLNEAIKIAEILESKEFLLLPEIPTNDNTGIDKETLLKLQDFVNKYSGKIPLSISQNSFSDITVCNPFPSESGLNSFAHIDAMGFLKLSSFDLHGIKINNNGVMNALEQLKQHQDGNK